MTTRELRDALTELIDESDKAKQEFVPAWPGGFFWDYADSNVVTQHYKEFGCPTCGGEYVSEVITGVTRYGTEVVIG